MVGVIILLIIIYTMIRKIFITVLCVAAMVTDSSAEGLGEGSVMTLRDCMEYAISNSTKLRIQQAATGDARIARRDALLQAFTPSLNSATYAYYNFGRSIDPETNTYFTQTSFHNSYSVSAGFDLFNGFQAVNNLKISKTGLAISQSQEKQAEADICLAVMEAYYNVVYFKRLADVYEEQVGAAELALKKAARQEELGQKGHADVVQMEADLADRNYDLINVWNSYNDQLMTLSDLMFWPEDQKLVIVTDFRSFAGAQDDNINAHYNNINVQNGIINGSVILSESEESIVNYALEHNPGVNVAEWTMLNAKRQLSTTKWQLLPSVGLYAGWSTSLYTIQGGQAKPFRDQFRNNGGEYLEMSVSFPIWGRMQKQSKIAKQRNALTKATAEYDQKRRDVESEVRRAIQDREGSSAAYRQAVYKSEVQSEAYNLNLKKLDQGLISSLEFQTATNNYLKAQADEMSSLFKYLIKNAVVRYYNGEEYINQ